MLISRPTRLLTGRVPKIWLEHGEHRYEIRMVAAVSAFDLSAVVAAAPGLEVWCQHLDPVGFGSNTGWLHPETAMERGFRNSDQSCGTQGELGARRYAHGADS